MMPQYNSGNSEFEVRILREPDLVFVDELVEQAGWNQLFSDWLRVLRYEPTGCFAAYFENRLVGTVTTTSYGRDLGWIGMMLVHPDFRRRGIATLLMRRSIAYLTDKQVTCIKLDATPAGQFVYEQLGFVAEWKFHRWELVAGEVPYATQASSTPQRDDELDRFAFGVDRSRLLDRLQEASITFIEDGGFGMLRPGRIASYLGPVVASKSDCARSMIGDLASRISGRVFWDIPAPNEEAQSIAEQLGFRPVRDLTRMRLGDMPQAPNLLLQYAIAGPETG